MSRRALLLVLILGAGPLAAGAARSPDVPLLRLGGTIALPDVRGRIDHLAADVAGQRLFVAALANGSVEVVDLATGRVAHRIQGLAEPSGIAFAADLGRLVVAQSGDGSVSIYDAASFALLHRVELGSDADNVRYDEPAKRAYVGYGDGGIAAIDAQSGEVLSRVALPAHPESFQLGATRLFVNVPGAGRVFVVDRGAARVVAEWPLDAARANYPLALDELGPCLYVGCRRPPRLLAIRSDTGVVAANVGSGGDCDDAFYDAATRRVYVSCGDGMVGVYRRGDGCSLDMIGAVPTARGARTSLFVPAWRRLFVAVPASEERPAEVRIYDAES